jgi:hypothetical protein
MKNDKIILQPKPNNWSYDKWILNNKMALASVYVEGFLLEHNNSDMIYLGYNPSLSNILEIEIKDINEIIPLNDKIDFGGQNYSVVGVLLSDKALIKSIELFRSTNIPSLIEFNNKYYSSSVSSNSGDFIIKGEQPDHDTRERERPEPRSSDRPSPERDHHGGGVRG